MGQDWGSYLIAAGGFFGGILAWLLADARSKTRMAFMDEKVKALTDDMSATTKMNADKISALEIKQARTEQQAVEINRNLDKLDDTKCSKEMFDGIRSEVSSFKLDMDKRFDRIERLLERNAKEDRES